MVSLSNRAYEELKKIRGSDESFSSVIMKLLNIKNDITAFSGALKSEEDRLNGIEKSIMGDRKMNKGRY